MKSIAIIGGGFSGTMSAVQLMKNSSTPLKIFLIEKQELGRGIAYAKNDDVLLLNVRADQMGAFPENPKHFFEWMNGKGISVRPDELCSRKLYGDYIAEIFSEALKSPHIQFEHIKEDAVDVDSQKKEVLFASRSPLKIDQIILAVGLDAKKTDFSALAKTSDLTIIGTGLSMIDAVVYLTKHNYAGKITAVSRHGRLPAPHEFYPPETPRPVYDFKTNHSLVHVLKTVKENLKLYPWRLVIDGLRPHNQFLWKNFTKKEKGQFIRHLRSLWDVHRHRMSPDHKKMIEELISNNKLEICPIGHQTFTPKTIGVLDCRGFSLGENTLIKNLINKKIAQTDPFKLGIQSNENGLVFENWIYTLGPLRRGDLWESTAVPEIRLQAKELALILLN
jgi:uncharacterized NAD(P)/FAD-binding protein YdhS